MTRTLLPPEGDEVPDDDAATPLRALPTTDDGGVRVIRDTGAAWLDGSEETLLERMRSGLSLHSLSDELFATATNWPEQYHLSPSRANVLRALDLPADATVLEIGAGCGAITRYLGETCAVVDAIEPTLARARVAAARTAELPGVAVFNGEISDVPQVPTYDLVVVVGVLEYVGGGAAAVAPYVEFLRTLRGVLRPGGRLVVAIENRLGVKYLAGAPEDHSGQVFHSVEGYPQDGPARTFSRRRLVALAEEAGFGATQVLGAFPDYKLTRVVYDDRLLTDAAELAVRIPRFPSPDWAVPRPPLLDEARLWAELVDAGAAAELANSLLLVATVDGADVVADLWPRDRAATYFSMRRRRAFQVMKRVELAGDGVVVASALLGSGESDGLRVLPYREPAVDGDGLVDRVLADPSRLADAITDWVRLLESRAAESQGTPFDVLPHNVHYVDGVPRFIDDEWRAEDLTLEDAKLRGAVLLARDLSQALPLDVWGAETVTGLAITVARLAGVRVDDDGVRAALDREAELQSRVGGGSPGTSAHAMTRDIVRKDLARAFDCPASGEPHERAWERYERAEREAVEARDLLLETGRQLDAARAELARSSSARVRRVVRGLRRRAGRVLRRPRSH